MSTISTDIIKLHLQEGYLTWDGIARAHDVTYFQLDILYVLVRGKKKEREEKKKRLRV